MNVNAFPLLTPQPNHLQPPSNSNTQTTHKKPTQPLYSNTPNANNIRLAIQLQLLLLRRRLARIPRIKDLIQLLQRAVLGLRHDEVDDEGLDGAPDAEDDVRLPLDVGEGDGEAELGDHAACFGRKRGG